MLTLVVVAHPDDEILGFGATGAMLAARGETVQPVILSAGVEARGMRPANADLAADIANANRTAGFAPPVLGHFPNIRMNNCDHIDLVQFIEEQIDQFRPARIVTHHPGDINNDHLQVSRACAAAARYYQRKGEKQLLSSLLYMEIPSATDWALPAQGLPFQPDRFVEIGDFIETKLAALGCYRNVMRPYPHPRSPEVLRALAALRGGQSGLNNAEAFQTAFCTGL
jgi:N-acetylglucosamine malate deacetylase 1